MYRDSKEFLQKTIAQSTCSSAPPKTDSNTVDDYFLPLPSNQYSYKQLWFREPSAKRKNISVPVKVFWKCLLPLCVRHGYVHKYLREKVFSGRPSYIHLSSLVFHSNHSTACLEGVVCDQWFLKGRLKWSWKRFAIGCLSRFPKGLPKGLWKGGLLQHCMFGKKKRGPDCQNRLSQSCGKTSPWLPSCPLASFARPQQCVSSSACHAVLHLNHGYDDHIRSWQHSGRSQ